MMKSARTEFHVKAAYAHHIFNLALPENFKLIEQIESGSIVVFTFEFEAEDDCNRDNTANRFTAWLSDTVLDRITSAKAAE